MLNLTFEVVLSSSLPKQKQINKKCTGLKRYTQYFALSSETPQTRMVNVM